ncbi:MAG TPA: hypothetical protein PKM56_04340 [Candidatus Rifleibacterium sp.]|nr:hypothetical protein [Candidatus Rifleibacterium sp.]
MTVKRNFLAAGLLLCGFMLAVTGAFAQAPSLAANDHFVVTVDTDNGPETYTVIRDGRNGEHFYYVPIKPTIATEMKDGKKMPVFNLLSYQTKDKEGGILQMSMVMGVPQATVDKIRSKLGGLKIPPGKSPKLSPMPIKSAELTLYDLGGDMLDQASPKGGIAPIFGTQHYPFMLKLKSLGTNVMEALCTKNGGLPVLITYTFQGMTPKAGFEVEVNWDTCYEHFSTDFELAAEVAKNSVSGALGLDISTLREKFITDGLIKINSLSGEAATNEQLDEVMNPVLNLIVKEMFEQIHAPASIPPAEAEKLKEDQEKPPIAAAAQGVSEAFMKATGRFFKVGVKVDFALKDVKIVKKGTFKYKFDRQAIVERTTSYGGLLGIGNFPKDIQSRCISTMPAGNWERAFYVLPAVGDPVTLGIKTLDISVVPEEETATDTWKQISGYPAQSAGFNKNKSPVWTDKDRKEILRFQFPLKALYDSENFSRDKYRFKIVTKIQPEEGRSVEIVTSAPIFDGDLPMAPPTDLVDVVTLDASCLTYGETSPEVFKVIGKLEAGKQNWSFVLEDGKTFKAFMVPATEKEIKFSSMNFTHKKGKLGAWRNVGLNLRELEPSLYIMLFDGEWEQKFDAEKLPADAIVPLD